MRASLNSVISCIFTIIFIMITFFFYWSPLLLAFLKRTKLLIKFFNRS